MPLPIVLATAVPKINAAMKFQNAAQSTALPGERTRVETTVAMELAASCQPFEKSNARAIPTIMMTSWKLLMRAAPPSRNHDYLMSAGRSSRVFQGDGFDYIGDVFAFIHGCFDYFDNFLPLDDLDGIFFFVEQAPDQNSGKPVGFIFKAVNLNAFLEDAIVLVQRANYYDHLAGSVIKDARQIRNTRADDGDLVS